MEEEKAHQDQVSVLSHMHLQLAEEVRAQSQEIWHLLALVEKQQEAIKCLSSPKSPTRELRTISSHSGSWLDIMMNKICNLIPGTVNTRQGTAVAPNSPALGPVVNRE